MPPHHWERHRSERIGWLRAAVLGANDGIVSTASIVLGVAGGEYVSVHSQADTERADIERERKELKADDAGGASVAAGAVRVTFWGALAMGLTAGVGALFGTIA